MKNMTKKKVERKINKNFILIVVSIFIVSISIFYVAETASLGGKLAKVEGEEGALIEANRDLSDNLVSSDSLSSFSKEQEQLGFTKPTKTIYLKAEDESVAKAF